MPLREHVHSVGQLNDLDGRVWSGNLTIQHAGHAPGIAVSLWIVPDNRGGDSAPVGRYVFVELRFPLGCEGGLGSRNIQLARSRFLSQDVRLQLIRATGYVAVSLKWAGAVPFACQTCGSKDPVALLFAAPAFEPL
jgi:hypothetical protein